ncbi:MAG: sigma-54-dependent Fis family transcriptional regulator [Magnetococcales bacterium]|nr:sigma-54-dependent Fis family transcriptional regulator [Magnetococcales bacterium]
MVQDSGLRSEERDLLTCLAEAIFLNPFNESPQPLDQLLPKVCLANQSRHEFRLNAISPVLTDRIAELDRRGLNSIRAFDRADRSIVEYAYLFQLYQEVVDRFDQLIVEQSRPGAVLAPVPFASDLLSQMRTRGISTPDSLRYIGLFYQLRRAYYFIVQSLVGDSPSMKKLRYSLWNNIFTWDVRNYDQYLWGRMEDFSTLLLGETGSGKGAAAAAIGRSGFIPFDRESGRFTENFMETFVAINLSQFSENIIESELFGHKKGAFTGAVDNHKGVFERCSTNGALFLDEIGDVSSHVQIKLLKVVQERTFTPVGSRLEQRFSGRVIAATNRSLQQLRQEGCFRDDFYYRLCSDEIVVPPLRQRIREQPGELARMVGFLVFRTTGSESKILTERVLAALSADLPKNYGWPGNVRELEQAVRRILLTGRYGGDPLVGLEKPDHQFYQQFQHGDFSAKELLSRYCQGLYKQYSSYEEVAKRLELDRRTVKKYIHGDSS